MNPKGIPQQSPGLSTLRSSFEVGFTLGGLLLRRTGEERATLGKRRAKKQPQQGCDPRWTLAEAETPLGFLCFWSVVPG